MSKKISFVHAWMWIVGSMLFCTGIFHKSLRVYLKYENKKRDDPLFYLSRIVQTGPQKEALNTAYLAELIEISANFPTSYAYFDPKIAEEKILKCPVVKEAHVKKIKPNTIYIDYTLRQPIAQIADLENTAIDEEGFLFPISPFFTPKNLPEIYLGIPSLRWNLKIEDRKRHLAFSLLHQAKNLPFEYKKIDVSQSFEENLGKREIVISIQDKGHLRFLRLNPLDYGQALGNYLELREKLLPETKVIDLRIWQLAFFN